MAYDRTYLLLTFNFIVIGTAEVANTTLHVTGAEDFDAPAALANLSAADLDELNGAMGDLMAGTSLRWANFSRYEGIKVAAKGITGADTAAPVERVSATTPSGSATTTGFAQDTVVISLRSPTTFGLANYGRMYLPHCAPNRVTATPQISDSDCTSIATNAGGFIERVNAVTGSGSEPGFAAIMSSKGSGATKAVTRVAVGSVLDTQRRRRNRLTETYQFVDVDV